MFLCDNCHNPDCMDFEFSRGPCEGCGKIATCSDCHSPQPFRKKQEGPKGTEDK